MLFTLGRREILTRRIRNDFAPHHTDGRARFLAGREPIWLFSRVNYPYKFDTILSSWRSPSFVGEVVSEKRYTTLRRTTKADVQCGGSEVRFIAPVGTCDFEIGTPRDFRRCVGESEAR